MHMIQHDSSDKVNLTEESDMDYKFYCWPEFWYLGIFPRNILLICSSSQRISKWFSQIQEPHFYKPTCFLDFLWIQ